MVPSEQMHILLSSGSSKNGNLTANVEGAMSIRRPATSKSFQREPNLGVHLIPTLQWILSHVPISRKSLYPNRNVPLVMGHWLLSLTLVSHEDETLAALETCVHFSTKDYLLIGDIQAKSMQTLYNLTLIHDSHDSFTFLTSRSFQATQSAGETSTSPAWRTLASAGSIVVHPPNTNTLESGDTKSWLGLGLGIRRILALWIVVMRRLTRLRRWRSRGGAGLAVRLEGDAGKEY
jgi:hypothetical protein